MLYLTLDDELTLLAAKEDPVGMIRSLDRAIIDEIQRAPPLLLAIKKPVDEDRRPGRFLLTGSVNLMALSTVVDSLAGRMETLMLLPLSQSEMHGTTLDSAFAGHFPKLSIPLVGETLVEAVLRAVILMPSRAPHRAGARFGLASTLTPLSSAMYAMWQGLTELISCPAFCEHWRMLQARCAITRNWAARSGWITRRQLGTSACLNRCTCSSELKFGPGTGSTAW